ncbi:WD40 repeat domain-containing protein, partial [Aphanizomenon flos-aquae CCAP 1446/1C]|nr:WD40 repeat domain-containing protein [Anabaena sp. CCAP 1446/1C]
IWSLKTGDTLINLPQSDGVRTVAFSPDGKILAGGGEGGKIMLWYLTTGKLKTSLAAHRKPI